MDQQVIYKWALEDARREMDSDFVLIKTVVCNAAVSYVKLASQMDNQGRWLFIQSVLKYNYPDALKLLGTSMTEQEVAEVKKFQYYRPQHGHQYRAWLNSLQYDPSNKIDVRKAMTTIINELKPALGPVVRKITSTQWQFTTTLEGSFVCTWLSLERLTVICGHAVVNDPGTTLYFDAASDHSVTSFLFWLGISGTEWDITSNEAVPAIAESITACSERFMELARVLIAADEG